LHFSALRQYLSIISVAIGRPLTIAETPPGNAVESCAKLVTGASAEAAPNSPKKAITKFKRE